MIKSALDKEVKNGKFRIIFDEQRLRYIVSSKIFDDQFSNKIMELGEDRLKNGTFDSFYLQDCFNLSSFSAQIIIDKLVNEGLILVDKTL